MYFTEIRHVNVRTYPGVVSHEEALVVTQQGVPVVTHVELFVAFARVSLVDGDQAVVTRELVEETSCQSHLKLARY